MAKKMSFIYDGFLYNTAFINEWLNAKKDGQ
jgi:hypothetical protein